MNALLIALTMTLTGAESTFDAPGSLAADLTPRAVLKTAPFPLQMSYFGTEESPAVDRLEIRSSICVTMEVPSYAELVDVKPLAAPFSFDGQLSRPGIAAQPAKTEKFLGWKNWEHRPD